MTAEHKKGKKKKKKHWVKYSTQNIHIIYGFQYLAKIGPSSFMVSFSLTQFNLVITCDFFAVMWTLLCVKFMSDT